MNTCKRILAMRIIDKCSIVPLTSAKAAMLGNVRHLDASLSGGPQIGNLTTPPDFGKLSSDSGAPGALLL